MIFILQKKITLQNKSYHQYSLAVAVGGAPSSGNIIYRKKKNIYEYI